VITESHIEASVEEADTSKLISSHVVGLTSAPALKRAGFGRFHMIAVRCGDMVALPPLEKAKAEFSASWEWAGLEKPD
jgi:hypothetical protein